MAHDDTPEAVQARWGLRLTFSPFDRERYHAEMDQAERRHGRRAPYRPIYRRPAKRIVTPKPRPDDDSQGVPR